MGAWGHQPKDNDTSEDDFANVAAAAGNALDKFFRRSRPDAFERWERLGVLQLAMEGMPIVIAGAQDACKVARDDIEELRKDKKWIASWKEPAKVTAALTAMARKIDAALEKM